MPSAFGLVLFEDCFGKVDQDPNLLTLTGACYSIVHHQICIVKHKMMTKNLICWNWRLATKYFIFRIARITVLCTGVMLKKIKLNKIYE